MNRRQLLASGAFGMDAAVLPAGMSRARRQHADLGAIETIVIHPAIGIARVGNSPDGWFPGPEAPGSHQAPPGGFKDDAAVTDPTASLDERQRAFATRLKWPRNPPGFGVSSEQRINAFIRQWHGAGVVTRQPGSDDDAPFPETEMLRFARHDTMLARRGSGTSRP